MSKSKMKETVRKAQRPEEVEDKSKKKKKQRKKWSDPRKFKFLPQVKWLPGFRSGKHWKRIVALMYYSTSASTIFFTFNGFMQFGMFFYVMMLTLPFMILSFIKFFQTGEKYYAIEALIAAFIFGADNMLLVYCMQRFFENAA